MREKKDCVRVCREDEIANGYLKMADRLFSSFSSYIQTQMHKHMLDIIKLKILLNCILNSFLHEKKNPS